MERDNTLRGDGEEGVGQTQRLRWWAAAGWLLAGTVYIETVFAWPGLGAMLVNAILQRDYPLVQGGVLLVAATYVLINLGTDLVYAYIDPRLRHA